MTKSDHKTFAAIVLAGTLALSSPAAWGNDRVSFRQFKNSHPGAERRELRQAFRAEFNAVKQNAVNNQPRHHIETIRTEPRITRDLVNRTFQWNDRGQRFSTGGGIELNLESASALIVLGEKLFEEVSSVTIDRGGEKVALSAGSRVTAAEYVAVKQMLVSGNQSLSLDGNGRAVGGNVDLSQITSRTDRMRAEDLTVPLNVTAYGDFGKGSTFQLLGDLVNAGEVYTTSTRHGVHAGLLRAENITNQSSGTITADQNVELQLSVANNLTNLGTISGVNNLTISAAKLVNSGTIESKIGSVSLTSPAALDIDNAGGSITAPNAAITIRDRSYNDSFATTITGGDLLSRELNINSGRSTVDMNVNQLTGTLNQKGLASHIFASTNVLSLGDICLDGDPTFSNSTGSIDIAGNIRVGEELTIIASQDITTSAATSIQSASNTSGFTLTMIAGANITAGGTSGSIGPIPPPTGGIATTFNGASATGGNITLGTVLVPIAVTTHPQGGNNNNGADIFLAAFDNAGANGRVDLSFATLTTGGKGTGNNGNVTIIAGGNAASGATITTGGIDTTGGSGTGGNINIFSFTPQSSGGAISYDQNGVKTSAATLIPSAISALGPHVLVNGNMVTAGDVSISTGQDGNITVGEFDITSKSKTGTINLTTSGLGNITGSDFTTITSQTVNLQVGTGDIGDVPANTPIFTNAQFVTANGDTSSTDVLLVSFNPGLNVFSGSAFSMNVATQGTIISDPGGPPITADTLLIGSFGGSAGINLQVPLEVDSTFLFVAGLGGDVFVHNNNTGQTNLDGGQALQAARTFNVRTEGTLGLAASEKIIAKDVFLQPASEFNNLAGTINASRSVSLISNLTVDPVDVTASITTPRLNVTSLTGNVGLSTIARFQPSATVGGVAAFAPTGDVFLQGSTASKAGLAGGSALNSFDYAGTGSTSITGNITTATNDIKVIINQAGTLSVADGVTITSGRDLTLLVTDPVSTKQKISLGKNSSIQTEAAPGFGNILISVGTPSAPVAGTPPTKGVGFVAVPPSQIFWGDFGISGKGINTVFAKGANVQFTNTIKSTAISLAGGVVIVADPPLSVGAGTTGNTGSRR